jgi:hypothetical protein
MLRLWFQGTSLTCRCAAHIDQQGYYFAKKEKGERKKKNDYVSKRPLWKRLPGPDRLPFFPTFSHPFFFILLLDNYILLQISVSDPADIPQSEWAKFNVGADLGLSLGANPKEVFGAKFPSYTVKVASCLEKLQTYYRPVLLVEGTVFLSFFLSCWGERGRSTPSQ